MLSCCNAHNVPNTTYLKENLYIYLLGTVTHYKVIAFCHSQTKNYGPCKVYDRKLYAILLRLSLVILQHFRGYVWFTYLSRKGHEKTPHSSSENVKYGVSFLSSYTEQSFRIVFNGCFNGLGIVIRSSQWQWSYSPWRNNKSIIFLQWELWYNQSKAKYMNSVYILYVPHKNKIIKQTERRLWHTVR